MAAVVQRIGEAGRASYLAHLLALPPADLHLRFGSMLAPGAIAAYTAKIDFDRDAVFAVHDESLAVVGAAHLGFADDVAELGLSVLPALRGRGIGLALLERAAEHARNRRIGRLFMHCLAENAPIIRVARRAGMSVVVEEGEADAHLALPPASPASVGSEFVTDQLALVDYALKANVDLWNRVMGAVSGGAGRAG
jgi:GNAT superfamily N-acetyltransferase